MSIDMVTISPSKILLVDNDPQFIYLMKRYVDNCGFNLVLADWSANIIALVEKERPRIVFMSVSQPEVDYSGLLRTLKSNPSTSKIPVIFCSTSEAALQDWMLEPDECLIQPIMYTDFIRIISEAGLDIHGPEGCL
jgi:chemotaxis family two-component system response regulator PixH